MKKTTIYISLLLLIASSSAFAQTFAEWTGTGTDWSDNSNWTTPYGYGQLEFKGNGNAISNNDFASTGQWRLYFAGGNSYSLTGNKVTFNDFSGAGSWLLSDSSVDQTIDFDVEFADTGSRPGWITTRAAGSFIFNNISAINNVTQIQFANNIASTKTTVNGILSGSKDIYIGRDESFAEQLETWVEFYGANTYTGNTYIDAGRLDALNPNALGVDADVYVANNGLLRVRTSTTIASVQERGSGNGGSVNVFAGATLTIDGANKGNIFQSKIIGFGDLVINTSGTTLLVVYSTSGLSGTVTIKSGAKLRLSGDMPNANIIIESGGSLEIEGSNIDINSLTVNSGGTVTLNDNKRLTVSGNVINDGTITLSTSNGGDLHIEGDFTQNGTLINNSRAVFFEGGNNQIVSGTSTPITFDYLRVDKSSGTLDFSEDIEISQPAGGTGYEQTNGDVNITEGKYLRVNNTGVFLINGGSFTLNSTNLTYSSLIADNVSGTGTVNYKRYTNGAAGTGTTTGSNDLVSAPLTGSDFGTFRAANSNILSGTIGTGTTTFYFFGPFDTSTNDYVLYNSADDTETMDAANAYRTGSDGGGTYTYTGTVETGIITKNIITTTSSIWNLIGNPYPSYMKLKEFLLANNGQFDTGSSGIYGYDGSASDGWTVLNLAYALDPVNDGEVIAPGQGFFVASKAGGGTVSFDPSYRTTGNTDDFVVGRDTNAITNLELSLDNPTSTFVTDIYFTEFSTQGLDPGFDSSLYGGSAPAFSIYSHLVMDNNGIPMAIQALAEIDYTNITVPLGINANQGEQLTFRISANTLPSTTEIYLDDTVANTSTLLNSSDYILTPSTNLSGTGRFFLRFADSSLSTTTNNLDTLNVYTNQNDKTIFITGQYVSPIKANVYDIQGRLVRTEVLSSNSNSFIDMSSVETGVYLVKLKNDEINKTYKVILK